jgi:hypothetical protein
MIFTPVATPVVAGVEKVKRTVDGRTVGQGGHRYDSDGCALHIRNADV